MTIVRSLLRTPGYFVTAVLTLALAIGASAAAFSVIDAVRFRALPFKDGELLVLLSELPVDQPGSVAGACRSACDVSYEVFDQVLTTIPFKTVELVSGFTGGAKALNTGTEPILLQGGIASKNLFALLGVKPLIGRGLTPEDDRLGVPLVTVLSYDLWVNQFGKNPGIVGQTVKLSDSRYIIVGVMPEGFRHEVNSQFWLPAVPTLDPSTRPSIRSLTVIARLRPGATVAQARSELAGIDPKVLSQVRAGQSVQTRIEVSSLRDRYASSTNSHDLIFAAIVGCILLIAGANLSNLTLLRTMRQQREFAVRASLGAGPGRLIATMLAQLGVVVGLATVLGLLTASWFLKVLETIASLNSLRPAGMEYRLDWRAIGFGVAVAVVVTVVLSLLPSWIITRGDLQKVLREGAPAATVGRRAGRAQQVFVVAQIVSAIVLLVAAGLMTKTVIHLSRLDLGFEAESAVLGSPSFPHPWRVKEKYLPVTRQIVDEMRLLPGAREVGVSASVGLGPAGAPPVITLEGQPSPLGKDLVPASARAVSPDYFKALGIRLLRGRAFTTQDLEATPRVAIVNQWAASHWWPGQDPVGKTFRVDTAQAAAPVMVTVVGLIADNRAAQANLLLSEDGPEVYQPYEQTPSPYPSFYVRAGAPQTLLKPTRELLARLVPDRPLFASRVSDLVDQQLAGVKVNAYQILGFALIGFALALIGLYGVLSFAVSRRTQELGIRGALGADRGQIRRLVLRDGAILSVLGLGVGLPAAAAAARLIQGLLYGTNRADPMVYVAVALIVLAVSLVAAYLPARRASRVDPLVALRSL